MTTSTGNISLINTQGPVSITTATNSTITQSTTSTSSHIRHNDADLQALTELFNNIRLAITTLPHHNDDNINPANKHQLHPLSFLSTC